MRVLLGGGELRALGEPGVVVFAQDIADLAGCLANVEPGK